jgi:DNA-binding CsgD family transcriptional regulator
MRAVLYVRLSKEDREGKKQGIDSTLVQETDGRAAIEAEGWKLIASPIIDDDVSGTLIDRDGLTEVRDLAKRKAIDVVVVRDLDRFSRLNPARTMSLLLELADHGVRLWQYSKRAFVSLSGNDYDLRAHPLVAHDCVDMDTAMPAEIIAAAASSATADYVENAWKRVTYAAASEVPGYDDQPAVDVYFRPRGIEDIVAMNAYDPTDRVGVWIGAPRPKRLRISKAQREAWTRISAHVANGYRLRRRVSAAEAILTSTGKTVHAEGDAKLARPREALRAAVLGIEMARGKLRRRPEEAILSWRALVAARWRLVDQFESDGKRYVVARTNAPTPEGPAALTQREKQVLAYAALGHTTKIIGYELGVSASTVRVLLHRAARKLGAKTRDELVALVQAM